jgi:hypothetical protein
MLRCLQCVLFITVIAQVSRTALGAEPVTVWLESGRTMTAHIDPRSNDTQLWIVRGDSAFSIARPIEWQRVVKAQQGEKALTRAELQALAKEVAAAEKNPAVALAPLPKWRGVFAAPAVPDQQAVAPAPPVRSLAIDAFHANWDSDVESDGLMIVVYPLDATGQLTVAEGTLEVELVAPEVRRFQDAPQGRGLTLERIGQWSAAVRPEDFTTSGARVQLPFQAVHPEFDWKILPHGMVHARLVVPGQGTFDTTTDFVRLRPWSPLRDKLWRDAGRRFLPTEQTGRGPRID